MQSEFKKLTERCFPPTFAGIRILHMPIILGDEKSIPDFLWNYRFVLNACANHVREYLNQVCYLTIDEKVVAAGETHRRSGLHVDGWYKTEDESIGGSWGGGGGGTWAGSDGKGSGTGLLTISNIAGCKAYNQEFDGDPEPEGDCEHLRWQCKKGTILKANTLYWLSPLCVHESLRMEKETLRQFIRLSLPSTADWYLGCTPNPLGVQPTGRIMSTRRKFLEM